MRTWGFTSAVAISIVTLGLLGGCASRSNLPARTESAKVSTSIPSNLIGHWRLVNITRRNTAPTALPLRDRTAWIDFTGEGLLAGDGVNNFQADYHLSGPDLTTSQAAGTGVNLSDTAPPIITEIVDGMGSLLDTPSGESGLEHHLHA